MSGTGPGDELAILIASFVEEVKPFFDGIRRGVAGVFALPRDGQAIGAARNSLSTIAASAKVLDFPAAWQLAELAQLLGEGFQAAERGGVPDESHTPMLTMVDLLEEQLDGLERGDDRGRERLDNAYRLLEQVLQTVEQAEAAPPPVLEIALDDLLLTLQPAAPEPEPEPIAEPVPEPVAPEPTQTELVLLSAEEVAPIEWGEKEAILWNKGGWDESKTSYGNTEWIFLDEEEITQVGPDGGPVAAAEDQVIETIVTAPLLAQDHPTTADDVAAPAPAASTDDTPATSAPIDLADTLITTSPLPVAEPSIADAPDGPGPTGELPAADGGLTGDLSAQGLTGELPEEQPRTWATGDLAAERAEAGATGELLVSLEAGATGQLPGDHVVAAAVTPAPGEPSAAPPVEQPDPAAAADEPVAVVSAEAGADELLDLTAAPDAAPAQPAAPESLAAPAVARPDDLAAQGDEGLDARSLEEAALLALTPDDLAIYLDLPATEQQAFLRARMAEMADFASDHGLTVAPEVIDGRDTGDLSALLTTQATDTGDLGAADPLADRRVASTDALIAPVTISTAKRPRRSRRTLPGQGREGTDRLLAGQATGAQAADGAAEAPPLAAPAGDQVLDVAPRPTETPDEPATAAETQVAAVDDLLLTEYRPTDHGTGRLAAFGTGALDDAELARAERLATDRLSLHHDESPAADDLDDADADEGGFLDGLLDDEPRHQQRLVDASDELFLDGDDEDADPNFAALPEVAPEIEAAFAQLSEADIATFLTLDGDAALAFLQSRTGGGEDAVVAPEDQVAEVPLAEAAAPEDALMPEEEAQLSDLGIDQEILEVFLQEAQELLAEWERTAVALRRAPADLGVMADLRRVAHTLKGAANMMGFTMLGAAGWRVEHLLDLLDERGQGAPAPVLDFADRSFALVRQLSADATADPQAFVAESAALDAWQEQLAAEIASGAPVVAGREDDDVLVASTPTPVPAPDFAASDELVDGELLDVFVQEAEEHLAGFNRALVELDRRPDDSAQLNEAKRVVHTLKGAAAALGYPVTAALCHSIEDLFSTLDEGGRAPSREMMTLFFESAEALEALVAGITAGRGEDAGRADALRARYAGFLGSVGGSVGGSAGTSPGAAPDEPQPTAEDFTRAAAHAPRSVRVDIAHLDNLLNLVGELVINRTGQEQHLEKLGRTVSELLLSVERLRRVGGQLESRYEVAELLRADESRAGSGAGGERGTGRPHLTLVGPSAPAEDEFDALEMDRYTELHRISRELVEIAADINAAGNELEGLYDSFDQTLSRQGRIATDLQDRMMEVRLVPLSTIAARLYRAVRGVATRRGRLTELVITGEAVEIDKVLLEEITDPLLHLVRNAADHGIESPEERLRRGKPEGGTIHLSASREGNEAVIRVRDDGAGIDIERVLDKALARGIIRRRDGLTREQALDLIFLPGFSTSATISDISGRGVGLDVVRTNVARLKGAIDVESTLGVGTTFTIRLPIMLAVTRALLVRSGAQTFAIPMPVVEQVAFFRKELVSTIGNNELFDLGGETYPVLYLNRALGIAGGEVASGARALIVGTAERRVALVVDELVGQQEIVVKRLGRHLQAVAGVAGATILGSGQVVLILNVLDLVGAQRTLRGAEAPAVAPLPIRPQPASGPRGGEGGRVAMVVDDSLSVRRVLTRTLERDGWQVLGAKDGVEALEMLAWARPQVMILDIEMPRMDGYELTSLLRNGVEHRDLPIAMLTSRAGEKHRRKALELGVSAYLVKPFEEAELLRTVRELGASARRQTVG